MPTPMRRRTRTERDAADEPHRWGDKSRWAVHCSYDDDISWCNHHIFCRVSAYILWSLNCVRNAVAMRLCRWCRCSLSTRQRIIFAARESLSDQSGTAFYR